MLLFADAFVHCSLPAFLAASPDDTCAAAGDETA